MWGLGMENGLDMGLNRPFLVLDLTDPDHVMRRFFLTFLTGVNDKSELAQNAFSTVYKGL